MAESYAGFYYLANVDADTRNAAAEILKRYAPMKMVEDE